jgi:hypothetical protein
VRWPWSPRAEHATAPDADGVVFLRFRKRYVPTHGPHFNSGEVATFPPAVAASLIRQGIAKRATPTAPRPTPTPPPLVPVRLTATRHTRVGRSYARGEIVGEDAATARLFFLAASILH